MASAPISLWTYADLSIARKDEDAFVADERITSQTGLAERLVRDTGISVEEARELIAMLGLDWSSLVREARILRKRGPSR